MDNLQTKKQVLLKKYIEKNISELERHELEKLALDDDFLFEAMEGYAHFHNAKEVKPIIDVKRSTGKIFTLNKILAVAASLILLFGAIFLLRPLLTESLPVSDVAAKESSSNTYAHAQEKELESLEAKEESESINETEIEIPRTIETKEKNLDVDNKSPILKDQKVGYPEKDNQQKSEKAITRQITKPNPEPTDLVKGGNSQPQEVNGSRQEQTGFHVDGVRIKANHVIVEAEAEEEVIAANEPLDNVSVKNESLGLDANTKSKTNKKASLPKIQSSGEDLASQAFESIAGVVRDQSGQPLIGANVIIADSDKGTITDLDGKFVLTDVPHESELVVSYTGFSNVLITADALSPEMEISLEESMLLEEVVVVGLGQQKMVKVSPSMGEEDFLDYVAESLGEIDHCSGIVKVGFQIDHDGKLKDFRIIDSLNEDCDRIAIGILMNGGTWNTVPPRKQVDHEYIISF